jgi:beta-barrel assembly-enhancing protease
MLNRTIPAVIAALVLQTGVATGQLTNSGASGTPSEERPTIEQLRAMGTAYVKHLVDSVGESRDPEARKDVTALLGKLRVAAGIPGKDFHWVLINDSSVNASAIPGGNLVIHIGLVNMARDVSTSQFPSDTARRHRRFTGFLGAVLGHEIAHHALGHTGEVARLLPPAPANAPAGQRTLEARIEQAMANPSMLREQAFSRDRELAADRRQPLHASRRL